MNMEAPLWYAVHTRFKCEKLVARQLIKKHVHAWVPVAQLARQYGRHRRIVEIPVISCYVFVQIQSTDRITVLETDHVAGFVTFEGKPAVIPEHEIRILQRIIGEGIETDALPGLFEEGEPVEIIQGALAGVRGKMLHHQNGHKFLIELERLGYTLQLTVTLDQIRPLSHRSRI